MAQNLKKTVTQKLPHSIYYYYDMNWRVVSGIVNVWL